MIEVKKEQIELALTAKCRWRNHDLIPQVGIEYPSGKGIADFIWITEYHGYATELEIKTSIADWAFDLTKAKWTGGFPSCISRFIYVVPKDFGLPSWVPNIAGIWHVSSNLSIEIAKEPIRLSKHPISKDQRNQWMSCFYRGYWEQRTECLRNHA